MPEGRFALAEVVQGLRQELAEAVKQAANEALKFELQEVELELQVAVTKEAGAEAKFKFWIFEVGGVSGAVEKGVVQTVRLKMKAVGDTGEVVTLKR